MLKIYVDKEPEWIDINPLDDDTYNDFVITGNRRYKEYHTDIEWYKRTTDVLHDIDADEYAGECLRSYGDIDRTARKALVKLYNDCRDIDDLETIAAAANILFPERHFETAAIRGYCQGDYNEVIYDAQYKDELKQVEAFYFGNVAELHLVYDEQNDDCWDVIPDFELWDIERANTLKESLLTRFGYDPQEECEIYVSNGYHRVKDWTLTA